MKRCSAKILFCNKRWKFPFTTLLECIVICSGKHSWLVRNSDSNLFSTIFHQLRYLSFTPEGQETQRGKYWRYKDYMCLTSDFTSCVKCPEECFNQCRRFSSKLDDDNEKEGLPESINSGPLGTISEEQYTYLNNDFTRYIFITQSLISQLCIDNLKYRWLIQGYTRWGSRDTFCNLSP